MMGNANNGGVIGGRNFPSRSHAYGVWNAAEAKLNQDLDVWPTQQDPLIGNVVFCVHGNQTLRDTYPTDATGQCSVRPYNSAATAPGPYSSTLSPFFGDKTNSFQQDNATSAIRVSRNAGNIAIGTADVCWEWWVRFSGIGNNNVMDGRPGINGFFPTVDISAAGAWLYITNSTTRITGSAGGAVVNTNYFCQYKRTGGNLGNLVINNVSIGTWVDTSAYVSTATWYLGGSPFGAGVTGGSQYDEFRMTLGASRAGSIPTARFPDY